MEAFKEAAHRQARDGRFGRFYGLKLNVGGASRHHIAHALYGGLAGIAESRQYGAAVRVADAFDHHRVHQHRQIAESDDAHIALLQLFPIKNLDHVARSLSAVREDDEVDLRVHPKLFQEARAAFGGSYRVFGDVRGDFHAVARFRKAVGYGDERRFGDLA